MRRFEIASGHWLVEGDTNGDGVADLALEIFTASGHALGVADIDVRETHNGIDPLVADGSFSMGS
ncbi:MAG: hypothetical protein ACOY5R_21955 [Pseudomonadota bacterium]